MHSDRLSYEPIRQDQADEVEHALCHPAVYYFINEPCLDLQTLRAAFQRREAEVPADRSNETWLDYLVRLRCTGEAIGRVEATVIQGNAEIAYLFGPMYWGKGYATESLGWLEQLLSADFGVVHFWATVQPGNNHSIKLLQRAGYQQAPRQSWPQLTSYDSGDLVFQKAVSPNPL